MPFFTKSFIFLRRKFSNKLNKKFIPLLRSPESIYDFKTKRMTGKFIDTDFKKLPKYMKKIEKKTSKYENAYNRNVYT